MLKTLIQTENAPLPVGPYNQAVLTNGILFVSGQIALDKDGVIQNQGDIADETRMVLKNLEAIIEAAELTLHEVAKCSIFVTNINDFGAINEVYGEFFSESRPARELVEVSALPKGARVEISCIATKLNR
ncbi:MAG: Rid family detoxifying hydrolase [Bacteroidota bacterium]